MQNPAVSLKASLSNPYHFCSSDTFITDYCSVLSDDWKADQYRWFQNGIKEISIDPVFKKKYYMNVTPDGKNSELI